MREEGIKNIVFDVGMVLVDFCWQEYCRTLGFSEETIQMFGEHMVLSDIWNKLDEGTITLENANDIFLERMPGYEKEINLFWEKQEGMVQEFDYAAPMLDKLKKMGYHVYLLSNYPEGMYQCHWPRFRFFENVDGFVVSSLEKIVKPDLKIYELLCKRYQLEADQCLFVDDRNDNVAAAKEYGMQGLVFQNYEIFKKDLMQLGVCLDGAVCEE